MWKKVQLGEICKLRNGRAYRKGELLAEGPYPVLRVGNFFTSDRWYYSDLELDETKYCDNGDLLYAWSASFGPKIWEGGRVIYHYHIWRVDFDEERVDKRYLFYWFEHDKELVKAASGTGTTMMHVSKGSMEKRELMLPPLADQRRIVATLDAAFAEIDRASELVSENISEIDVLKFSIFREELAVNSASEFHKLKKYKIVDVCDELYAGGDAPPKELRALERTDEYTIPIFSNGVENAGLYGFTNYARTHKPAITISARGTIGHVELRTTPFLPIVRLIVAVPNTEIIHIEYLKFALSSFNIMSSGSSIPQLTVPMIKELELVLPNLETQQRIVEKLKNIASQSEIYRHLSSEKMAQYASLRSAILAQELRSEAA